MRRISTLGWPWPIVTYLLSTKNAHDRFNALVPEEAAYRLTALRDDLAQQLANDGVIRITKESGLFVARRDAEAQKAS